MKIYHAIALMMLLITGCSETGQDFAKEQIKNETKMKEIRYVAIGDSYTIGEGIEDGKSYPYILTKNLNSNGISIQLVANPSRTGWTTNDAIEKELPVLRASRADFVTVLIGVNDWVRGAGNDEFNEIIKDEAKKRNIKVVDINIATKQMSDDEKLVAQDGLHPSEKEYEIWEEMIYPHAYEILKK